MTKRILRLNQLIKRELSQILLREVEFPSGVLITVTRVETVPDLAESKVYISCMPEDKSKNVFQILNRQIYKIQHILNRRLKIKLVPRIKFMREEKTKEAGRIEELLEKIKKDS